MATLFRGDIPENEKLDYFPMPREYNNVTYHLVYRELSNHCLLQLMPILLTDFVYLTRMFLLRRYNLPSYK